RLYTLSEKTRNVLKDLHTDVEAVVFLAPQEELYTPVKELLARYAAASPHIRVRMIDPQKNPVEAEQLVKKYEVTSAGVVIATPKDRRVLDSAELADFDLSGMQLGQKPEMTGFKGEQLFTSALLQLSEGRKPKILFTTGHGEASLDDQGPHGLSGAQEILGRDNFDISEWASLGKPAIPDGTDMVVIAGPKASFVQPELDILSAYLKKGGRVLALVDPVLGKAAGTGLVPTGLEAWLAGYGVSVGQNIVVDPSNPLPFFGAETIFANRYGDHAITKSLKQGNLPVLLSLARSVGKGNAAAGFTVTQLVETSAGGWGETDLAHLEKVAKDATDLAGPVPLAVAVTAEPPPDEAAAAAAAAPPTASAPAASGKPRGMRLVVFGDSDFAGNQLLRANVGNSVLLSNALNWLVERESLLGIPPKKTEQVHLSLTQSEIRTVYLLALGLLPGLGVVLGVFVYLRRRR
ncbi:MAG TPA: GldG family protein, partial [Thermoanaerobaculia bacterium]|nr:GldG family protein [Thermoanaerobaculia bacterium]